MDKLYKANAYLTDYWYCLAGGLILALISSVSFYYHWVGYLPAILAVIAVLLLIVAFVFLIMTLVMVIQGLGHREVEDTTPLIILLIGIFLSFIAGIGIILMIIGHVLLKKSIKAMNEA